MLPTLAPVIRGVRTKVANASRSVDTCVYDTEEDRTDHEYDVYEPCRYFKQCHDDEKRGHAFVGHTVKRAPLLNELQREALKRQLGFVRLFNGLIEPEVKALLDD